MTRRAIRLFYAARKSVTCDPGHAPRPRPRASRPAPNTPNTPAPGFPLSTPGFPLSTPGFPHPHTPGLLEQPLAPAGTLLEQPLATPSSSLPTFAAPTLVMVLTRSYAELLVDAGIAHYGRVVHQHARRWREVIRGERIDYVLGVDVKLAPKDPPCWHPKGLPDRLPMWPGDGRQAPRKKKPKQHDVLTEHGKGHKAWKRPKPDQPKKPAQLRRRCPNCGALTNVKAHCVGVPSVPLEPPPVKPPTVLKRAYQPYRARTFRRVCQCGELTNDQAHCEGLRTFAR